MRVTGGYYRNSMIKSPKGRNVRPTSDRVREALFNILAQKTEGAFFLDLFAGSGTVGIEALSRGAEKCIFIENNNYCVKIINENLNRLNIKEKSILIKGDVIATLNGRMTDYQGATDIIYCDPPYNNNCSEGLREAVYSNNLMNKGGLLIIEHSQKTELKEDAFWQIKDKRKYGEVALTFFQLKTFKKIRKRG